MIRELSAICELAKLLLEKRNDTKDLTESGREQSEAVVVDHVAEDVVAVVVVIEAEAEKVANRLEDGELVSLD